MGSFKGERGKVVQREVSSSYLDKRLNTVIPSTTRQELTLNLS